MSVNDPAVHPPPQTLAAFAEGNLPRREVAELMEHLDHCPRCRETVAAASEVFEEEGEAIPDRTPGAQTRPWMWLAAAAAVVLLAATSLLTWRHGRNDAMARLVSLAPKESRSFEPRLSGGFAYAPYRGALRAGDAPADPATLKLAGEAGELTEKANHEPTADTQHAAGVGLLLIDRPADSLERLRDATRRDPNDARAWSDLAAAQYAAALQTERPSLYSDALASADRALQLDAKLAEAAFNRALILERLGLTQEAVAAWKHYLALDPSSGWASEARKHLQQLPPSTSAERFQRELPSFERAVDANDAAAIRAFVAKYPQQVRAYAEGDWLGRWGGKDAHLLAMLRAAGDALRESTGESLLHDAVAVLEPSQAATHALYREARIAYHHGEPKTAEPMLHEAARQYAAMHSPMEYMARHYAACTLFDLGQKDAARRELEALLAELPPRYIAARSFAQWELGLALMNDGDWSGALPLLQASSASFRQIGDHADASFVETLLADTLAALGRPDESWGVRIRSFQTLSAAGYANRLPVSIAAAARFALRTGHADAAGSLLRIEEASARAMGDDVLVAEVLASEALLAASRNDASAAAYARDAEAAAQRLRDPALRARLIADADVANGAVALRDDPRRAHALLSRAIETYEARQLHFQLPEAHLLRGRASKALGGDAASDFEAGIAAMERHPVTIAGALVGTGVLHADAALFEEAITLALDRGDIATAFRYAEREHNDVLRDGPPLVSAATLQERLAGSGAAVLEVLALPDEVVSFCVTADRITAARKPATREQIQLLAADDREESATALYDLLIRPNEDALRGVRHLIVVPGRLLEIVPFAALCDARTRQHLIDRCSVAMAQSASALRRDDATAPRTMLAVALPSGDMAALPESQTEVSEVQRGYGHASAISGGDVSFAAFVAAAAESDVVHIAGHTEAQPGSDDRALVFAGHRVTWSSIASTTLAHAPVVVLAGCETLRAAASPDARASSLGGGFLAAGARDVIGTLVPIADHDARELFREIHRQLAAGVDPAEAVRRVQTREATTTRAWRAIALLTRTIPREGGLR